MEGGGHTQGRQFHIQTSLEGNRVENSAQLLSYLPLHFQSWRREESGRETQTHTKRKKEREREREISRQEQNKVSKTSNFLDMLKK